MSRLDVTQLREEFSNATCKNLEIDDLQGFIEQKLGAMLSQNSERKSFAEAFQEIINRYNAGSIETEQAFDELMKFFSHMSEEQRRASQEGLTEQELEVFDILRKEQLSKEDERKVKYAAQDLLTKLKEHEAELCTVDWYKDSTKNRPSISLFVIHSMRHCLNVTTEPCLVKNMRHYVLSLSIRQQLTTVCYSPAKGIDYGY